MTGTSWTDAMDRELRRCWAEGLSTASIGERMGMTKNSIVGRARRLDLRQRPSPIALRPAKTPPAAGETPVQPARVQRPSRAKLVPRTGRHGAFAPSSGATMARPERTTPNVRAPVAASHTCRWIEGDPKAPGGPRWCGEPSAGTTSLTACYCARHAARAISRSPQDREAA